MKKLFAFLPALLLSFWASVAAFADAAAPGGIGGTDPGGWLFLCVAAAAAIALVAGILLILRKKRKQQHNANTPQTMDEDRKEHDQ